MAPSSRKENGTGVRKAGGIVIRQGKLRPKVLIVTSKKRKKRWVLPKGHVEKGERASEAAVREVREEAGVEGRGLAPAATVEYTSKEEHVRLEYFLIEYVRSPASAEKGRKRKWCSVEDAIQLLEYATARRVLLESYPSILKHTKMERTT